MPDERPIIIGGCYRSGTSLVRRMLNAHSRIFCGPEAKFFRDFYGNYQRDPLRHLRFAASARSLLPEQALLLVLGRAFVEVQTQAAARAGKPRWADKNPENVVYLTDWERLLGEDWLFVHVVRNPLDTAASMKQAGFPLSMPTSLDGRIAMYRRYVQAGMDYAAAHPERSYQLVYERLVRSPEVELLSLMQWLGETPEPAQLDYNSKPQQQGLEDPKVAGTSHVHAESLGRWPRILSHYEARRVWEETHDLWAQVDVGGCYPLPPPPPYGGMPAWRVLWQGVRRRFLKGTRWA